jgi:hypothetical protein
MSESPIKTIEINKKYEKKNHFIKRDINQLISACGFEFLSKLLQNRKICLNEILMKELQSRNMKRDDDCVKQFCLNCCFMNYGNTTCNICK